MNAFLIFHVVFYTGKEAPEQIIESSDSKLLVTPSPHGKSGFLSPYYVSATAFLLKKIIRNSEPFIPSMCNLVIKTICKLPIGRFCVRDHNYFATGSLDVEAHSNSNSTFLKSLCFVASTAVSATSDMQLNTAQVTLIHHIWHDTSLSLSCKSWVSCSSHQSLPIQKNKHTSRMGASIFSYSFSNTHCLLIALIFLQQLHWKLKRLTSIWHTITVN